MFVCILAMHACIYNCKQLPNIPIKNHCSSTWSNIGRLIGGLSLTICSMRSEQCFNRNYKTAPYKLMDIYVPWRTKDSYRAINVPSFVRLSTIHSGFFLFPLKLLIEVITNVSSLIPCLMVTEIIFDYYWNLIDKTMYIKSEWNCGLFPHIQMILVVLLLL